MKERALFATKIGVIAATVGSAVGLGNIWRFPYEAGEHGGGAFILVYIFCVLLVGIPVICAEFVMGRGTHKNAMGAFRQLQKGKYWQYCSYIGILSSLMILSFYSVVAGWTLEYSVQAIAGNMTGEGSITDFSGEFQQFTASPWRSALWTVLFLGLNYFIVRRGVQKGLERISNLVMPVLGLIMIVLCVNSLMLPGAADGLEFLFKPDFSEITPSAVLSAMGQAFFSLSLGLSGLLIYSSYYGDDVKLVRSAGIIAFLDTLVAVVAGIIIFGALFTYGGKSEAGPKLVFEILPSIFASMPGGYFWAVAFFLLLFFASITSTISMSEIAIAFFSEEYKISRNKASTLVTCIALVFGTLCALSFGVLDDVKIFGFTFFDLFDYTSSNILLPLGGIIFSVFVGWFVDRNFVKNQLTNHGTIKVRTFEIIVFLMRYVSPVAIFLIFLYGLKIIQF